MCFSPSPTVVFPPGNTQQGVSANNASCCNHNSWGVTAVYHNTENLGAGAATVKYLNSSGPTAYGTLKINTGVRGSLQIKLACGKTILANLQ
jgi:hypothetical protein